MRKTLDGHPEIVEVAEEAIRRAGVEPVHTIIRGGTDGARLTEKGLPTPNLFTGGQHYHSLREWASLQDMAAAAATCVELVKPVGCADRLRRSSFIRRQPMNLDSRATRARSGASRR